MHYLPIYEDSTVTFGIFCLGKGAAIPLHDHFNMTVMSRLLFGRMGIKSYDWVLPPKQSKTLRYAEARLVRDTTLVAPSAEPMVLFSSSGKHTNSRSRAGPERSEPAVGAASLSAPLGINAPGYIL